MIPLKLSLLDVREPLNVELMNGFPTLLTTDAILLDALLDIGDLSANLVIAVVKLVMADTLDLEFANVPKDLLETNANSNVTVTKVQLVVLEVSVMMELMELEPVLATLDFMDLTVPEMVLENLLIVTSMVPLILESPPQLTLESVCVILDIGEPTATSLVTVVLMEYVMMAPLVLGTVLASLDTTLMLIKMLTPTLLLSATPRVTVMEMVSVTMELTEMDNVSVNQDFITLTAPETATLLVNQSFLVLTQFSSSDVMMAPLERETVCNSRTQLDQLALSSLWSFSALLFSFKIVEHSR